VTHDRVKTEKLASTFLQDAKGSILPITAVAMIALAGMVGGGVDMSRAYMVQNRLQNACDAGALAGRRGVDNNGYDSAAQQRATDFFETNFDEAKENVSKTSFVTSTPDNGNTVIGTASTTVDTVIVRLFGFDEIPLTVNCRAAMSVGNSDVMMVLDVTGSMDWDLDGTQNRITALKAAMKSFYDTVDAATSGSNARVRYGFVPYSSGVNVGELLYNLDPTYIADTHTVQSREAVFKEVEVETFSGWGDPYTETDNGAGNYNNGSWEFHDGSYRRNRDCRNEIPANTSWVNSGTATTTSNPPYVNGSGQRVTETVTSQPQVRTQYTCTRVSRRNHWVIKRDVTRDLQNSVQEIQDPIYTTTTTTEFDRWNYKAVNYDTSNFKTFASVNTPTGTDGADEASTWEGCVEERETVAQDSFSYSPLLGLTPSNARDLDIDSAPTGNNDTKWKPMWSQVAYYRQTASGYLTSAAESEYGGAAWSTCPRKAQLLTPMTETQFDNYADSLTPSGSTYHNIGMVWGARLASPTGMFSANVTQAAPNGGAVARHLIFMSDGEMSTNYSILTPYGIEWHDRRVTDNGYSDHNDRHTARYLAACEIAKSKGIRVWVIAFATGLTSDLETCASDDSAFTASSADELNTAFQEIAKDVGELRITQ
jgi:Flp pilus assembly protein TadG